MLEQLRRGRNRHVAYTLDVLAQSAQADAALDGMLTIVCGPRGFEFYSAGVLLDRPKDALAALAVLMDRVRLRVERENVAPS